MEPISMTGERRSSNRRRRGSTFGLRVQQVCEHLRRVALHASEWSPFLDCQLIAWSFQLRPTMHPFSPL
jgi:hypothetical protein